VAVSAALKKVPLVFSGPLQPPDAVHEVALAEDQVKVELPPVPTEVGFALKVTVGPGDVAGSLIPEDEPPHADRTTDKAQRIGNRRLPVKLCLFNLRGKQFSWKMRPILIRLYFERHHAQSLAN
jgi:hypothetical protein